MPKNNNLKPTTLPMKLRFGEKPTTNFINNIQSINVTILNKGIMDDIRNYIPQFINATWEEPGDTLHLGDFEEQYSVVEKDRLIRDVFEGKALPTAMETINVVFKIEGISLQEVTHILRYRNASFSADCSGDKWWTHKNALVPNSIQNSGELYKRYKNIVEETKQLYCDMIDTKEISIMDARYILPRCLETFYYVRMNLRDCIHFIKQRIDKQIQPETDNIIAYRLYMELIKEIPVMANLIDLSAPSMHYVKTARTGKATNLYFPDEDSDIFEWNENDFIYQKRRDEMNGTEKGALNMFNNLKSFLFEKIKDIEKIAEYTLRKEYVMHANIPYDEADIAVKELLKL